MKSSKVWLPQSRARLAIVLRVACDVISVDTVTDSLSIDRKQAAKLLSRWSSQGWLRRVGPGLYVPAPLELSQNEQVVTDPWVLVPALFAPCYLGGWTAAHHWDLTEQIFNDILVFTTRRLQQRTATAQGTKFILRQAHQDKLFGLKTIWRGQTKISISDKPRTIVDLLATPETGGGIHHVSEILRTYLRGPDADRYRLIEYADQFGNGAIFKRLGFLLSGLENEKELSAICASRLTQGYAKLDMDLPCERLETTWRIWVPRQWRESAGD